MEIISPESLEAVHNEVTLWVTVIIPILAAIGGATYFVVSLKDRKNSKTQA